MKFSARRNIQLGMAFTFMWMFIPVIAVMVPFLTSLNFSMKEIFLLQAYFGLVVAAFEVPSGYFADVFGRVLAIRLGSLFAAIGFTYLFFITEMWEFILYETLIGISLSLVSGVDFSIIYDSLKAAKSRKRDSYTTLTSNYQFALLSSEAASAIFAAFAVLHSMSLVIFATAAASWVPLVLSFFLKEPPVEKMSRESHWENWKEIMRFIFWEKPFLRQLFLNFIIWSLSTFCAVWIIQKVWQDQGIELFWFGILWAFFQLVAGVTGKVTARLEGRFGAPALFLVTAGLAIFGYLGLALAEGVAALLIGVLFYVSRGLTAVLFKDALNWRLPSRFRATGISLVSFCFRGSFFFIGPVIGLSIDQYGTSATLLGLAGIFSVLFFVLMIPFVIQCVRLGRGDLVET